MFGVLYGSTLNLSISSYPSRLNPILASDSASGTIADWLFSGLLKYDKDANIVGDLANSYKFINKTTIIFKLKSNLLWHDGKPLNAYDVKFTYDMLKSNKVFSSYTTSFRLVKKVEVLDALTIKVEYKQPYFKALENWMLPIIPKHILENEKDLMTSSFNQNPIGQNSYMLKKFEISKNIELYAFKDYKPHKPNIDKVVYKYVQDPSTEFLMLKANQLDIGSLSPIQIERQIDDNFKKNYQIIEQSGFSYTYLGFNLKKKPFDNPKVREALNYAIDKKELVDILFFGHGSVCNGPFLKGSLGFNSSVKSPEVNITKAKQLLKEAGFDKNNPLEFTLKTNANNPTRKYAAEIIQYQLQKAGIKVKLKIMEWQAFLNQAVHARNFDAILLGWGLPLMPDPYNIWHSKSDVKGGFNFVGYKNKKVDKLIEKSSTTINRKKLDKIFQEIFTQIVKDNPYIFLYIPNSITVVSKKISPIKPTLLGIMHNKNEWIKF